MNAEQAELKVGDWVMPTVTTDVLAEYCADGQQFPAEVDIENPEGDDVRLSMPGFKGKYGLWVKKAHLRLATPAEIQQAHKGGKEA